MTALARLATGQPGPETEAMIAAFLAPIADCWDCADFYLVPLLWIRARYAAALSPALLDRDRPHHPRLPLLARRARQRRAVVLLREPRAPLPHRRLPRRPPPARRPLPPLRPHRRRAVRHRPRPRPRLARPLRALGDGRVQLRPLLPHRPQGPDRALRPRPRPRHPRPRRPRHRPPPRDRRQLRPPGHPHRRPGPLLRALPPRRPRRSSSPPSPACSGAAAAIGARFHALPQLALCLRDHGLALPDLAPRALWQARRRAGMVLPPGRERLRGALPLQDPRLRPRHRRRATAGANGATRRPSSTPASAPSPQAQIWINHPGELIQSGSARPSYWGGSASIPRVQQYRALALVAFDGTAAAARPHPRLVPPRRLRRERTSPARAAFARSGDGLAALVADGPLERDRPPAPAPAASSAAPAATAAGSSASATRRLLAAFRARFAGLALTRAPRRPHRSLTIPTTVWSSSTRTEP